MARCLRCGAGSEWIEGKVPDENLKVPRRNRARSAATVVSNRVDRGPDSHIETEMKQPPQSDAEVKS